MALEEILPLSRGSKPCVALLAVASLAAAPQALACTSFVLEGSDGLYFAHSINQCSMPRVEGHVFVNPRDT